MIRSHVLICGGTGCTSSGSPAIREHLEKELKKQGLDEEIKVVQTGCFGLCALGPIMIIYPEGTFYSRVTEEDVTEIVSEHLLKGRPVERLVYNPKTEEMPHGVTSLSDTPFYKSQMRIALRNCGVIDPEQIDEYIALDGYLALGKALTEMTPQQVIDLIKASGLRGRGGAGFPTGTKWNLAAAAKVREGGRSSTSCATRTRASPARSRTDPSSSRATTHDLVFEGMTIGALCDWRQAGHSSIVRGGVRVSSAKHLEQVAIEQARGRTDLLGQGHRRPRRLRASTSTSTWAAGAYVCGEETALIESASKGFRGEPRNRPPFPAVDTGFDGQAHRSSITSRRFANMGPRASSAAAAPEWFKAIGTEKCGKVPKLFALVSGKTAASTGVVRDSRSAYDGSPGILVEGRAAAIPGGKKFKAVQIGGASGYCVPTQRSSILAESRIEDLKDGRVDHGQCSDSRSWTKTTAWSDVAKLLHGVLRSRKVVRSNARRAASARAKPARDAWRNHSSAERVRSMQYLDKMELLALPARSMQ